MEKDSNDNNEYQQHWEVLNSGAVVVSNTPEDLWLNAIKYFKWCSDNPIVRKRTLVSGKEAGKLVKEEQERPYSIKALCLHCGITEEYIRDIRSSEDKSNVYYQVVSKVLYLIYTQNLENATVGIYNPIFVSKVLNMEKDDIPTKGITIEIMGGLPELSTSENEILKKLEDENPGMEKEE